MKKANVFEIFKWVLIMVFVIVITLLFKDKKSLESSFEAYKKNGTYITQYQSKTIRELKKTNRELYDSIKDLKDVKQAVIIKYQYKYKGDTIYLDRELTPMKDSLYAFNKKSDTISYTAKVKSPCKPYWCSVDFTINDKLTLVNRENNGNNQLTISTNGGTITGTQVFNLDQKPDNFWNRFSFTLFGGPGFGYTLTANGFQPGLFLGVGLGVGYRLNSKK